ncbi:MAG: heme-binding protein [Methanomassiliicoccales archaeon]
MTETTPYEVLESAQGFELRRYPTMVLAMVEGMSDESAFRLLFRYISGENRARQDISMTVPVISKGNTYQRISMTRPAISGTGFFAFVLPSYYSISTAPQPLDERVKLVEIKSRILAVLRFSGKVYEETVKAKERELLQAIEERGLRVKGDVFLMRYNGPGTPGFLRRNEVAVEV